MRVRLPKLEGIDLNRFEFDFDLTMMIFLINADEHIFGRYGGRDAKTADGRVSLAGLRYAMQAALEAHRSNPKLAVSKAGVRPRFIRDLTGGTRRGCVHCHEVNEIRFAALKRKGQWTRDHIWRYPLPDNLGFTLKVDRGDVVQRVERDTPAARLGLRPEDVLTSIGVTSVHSLADAQFAFDNAPKTGSIPVAWRRGETTLKGELKLDTGWRTTDISWRRSMQRFVPSARVFGRNLKPRERQAHGLSAKQLAFWQLFPVSSVAKTAGIREQDIILGFDGIKLEMTPYDFLSHVRSNYLVGDKVTVNVLRGKKRLNLPMQLR